MKVTSDLTAQQKQKPEYTKIYSTHNSNSSKRHDGQLVRKLFQPEEFGTVMQKDKEM